MDALKLVVWPPMSSTERSQHAREGLEYRWNEQALDKERKHQMILKQYDDEIKKIDDEIKKMEDEEKDERERALQEEAERPRRLEERDRAKHAAEWSELCGIFRSCGLQGLATVATLDSLRAQGILPSLYETPSPIPPAVRRYRCSTEPPHPLPRAHRYPLPCDGRCATTTHEDIGRSPRRCELRSSGFAPVSRAARWTVLVCRAP